MPGWCRGARFEVNGEPVQPVVTKGYATIEREWRAGDEIRLHLEMPVERLSAHPAVAQDTGRVALKRGPVVYCLEEVDNGIAPQRFILKDDPIESEFVPDLLGGAVVLTGEAEVTSAAGWGGALYRSGPPSREPRRFRAIPYHLWANREAGGMQVWIRADGA